jgi:hypothetical protein
VTSPAEDALFALAQDLIEEIAAGRALELAAAVRGAAQPVTPAQPVLAAVEIKRGAAAVHPHLGERAICLPGDTLSGHAYAHLAEMQGRMASAIAPDPGTGESSPGKLPSTNVPTVVVGLCFARY